MGIAQEFKEFAVKGNMVDMAVGIIIGGAFSGLVRSLVDDVVMPPVGTLLGGVDFTDLMIPLDGNSYESLATAREAGAPVLAYGSFLQTCLSFLIVAWAVFLVVKAINRLRRRQEQAPEPEKPAETAPEVKLLTEIRDALTRP
ncbi:MAG TPA: large conductance mechanosensitive channel protein MscL [Thermoanaerobaculia bacterium]|nr:large conductance mechanosensitive channel protein MscL [Thermoanaerobaculia bacterium]